MDLVTNADVLNSWPGFASLPADEQAALISDASQAIEDYCRRTFDSGTVTEIRSGNNHGRLWLHNTPVVSIASLTIRDTVYTNADGNDWVFVPGTGELVRGSGLCDSRFAPWFPRGTNNIAIVYSYGYATVPGPVKRACLFAIRQLAEASKRAGLFDSERIGDYSYTRGQASQQALPDYALSLLQAYVRNMIF